MPPEILRYPPANDDWTDVFGQIDELPRPGERWTVRRKAAVIAAAISWLAVLAWISAIIADVFD
jgi:hypothetical protein